MKLSSSDENSVIGKSWLSRTMAGCGGGAGCASAGAPGCEPPGKASAICTGTGSAMPVPARRIRVPPALGPDVGKRDEPNGSAWK